MKFSWRGVVGDGEAELIEGLLSRKERAIEDPRVCENADGTRTMVHVGRGASGETVTVRFTFPPAFFTLGDDELSGNDVPVAETVTSRGGIMLDYLREPLVLDC